MGINVTGNLITPNNNNLPEGEFHDLPDMFGAVSGLDTLSEGADTLFNTAMYRLKFTGRFHIIPGQRLIGAYPPTEGNFWIEIADGAEFLIDGRIVRGGDTIIKNWLAIHHTGFAQTNYNSGMMHGSGGLMSSYGGNIKSDSATIFIGSATSNTNAAKYILQDMDIEGSPNRQVRFASNAIVQDTNLSITGSPIIEYSNTVSIPTDFQPSSQGRIIQDIRSQGRNTSEWNDGAAFIYGSAPTPENVANEPFVVHRYPKFKAVEQGVFKYTVENKGKLKTFGIPPFVLASNSITRFPAGAKQGYAEAWGQIDITNEDQTGAAINKGAKYVFRTHNHAVSPRLDGSSTGFPNNTETSVFQGTIGDISTNRGVIDLLLAVNNKYTGTEAGGLSDFAPFTRDPQGHSYRGWMFIYGFKRFRLDPDFGSVFEEPQKMILAWETIAQIIERNELTVAARTAPLSNLNQIFEGVEAIIYGNPVPFVDDNDEAIIPIAVGDGGEFEIESGWTLRRNTEVSPSQLISIDTTTRIIDIVTTDEIQRGTFSSVGGLGTVHSSLESIIDAPLRRSDGTVRFSVDVELPATAREAVYGVFPASNADIDRTGIVAASSENAIFLQSETEYKLVVDAIGAMRSGIISVNTGINGNEVTVNLNAIVNPLDLPLIPTEIAPSWAFIPDMFILNEAHTEALIRLPEGFENDGDRYVAGTANTHPVWSFLPQDTPGLYYVVDVLQSSVASLSDPYTIQIREGELSWNQNATFRLKQHPDNNAGRNADNWIIINFSAISINRIGDSTNHQSMFNHSNGHIQAQGLNPISTTLQGGFTEENATKLTQTLTAARIAAQNTQTS